MKIKSAVFWKNPKYSGHKPLYQDIEADYVIVGGGISGVTLAYFLAREQAGSVVLIEKKQIGNGATGHSAGMLGAEMETSDLPRLSRHFGVEKAKIFYEAQLKALREIKHIIVNEKIACDFEEDPLFIFCNKEEEYKVKSDEKTRVLLRHRARNLVNKMLRTIVPAGLYTEAEKVHNGFSVNPLACVQGIGLALKKHGVQVYEDTAMVSSNHKSLKTSNGHTVNFKHLIIATDGYNEHAEIKNFKTTIAVTAPLTKKQLIDLRLVDHHQFIDCGKRSFHYGKVMKDNRLLIGYGDVKIPKHIDKYTPHEPHVKEINHFLKHFSASSKVDIAYAWTGTYGLAQHQLPIVKFEKTKIIVGGAGTQIVSILSARYIANHLLGHRQALDFFFNKS